MVDKYIRSITLENLILMLISILLVSTSFIYGSGYWSSDADTWVKQWLAIQEHNQNFPAMVKVIFNLLTTSIGYLWHFNFLQNAVLYFGSYFLIRELLIYGGYKNKLSSIIALIFVILFFMNPMTLSHTSKWYIDYLFSGLLVSSLAIFINSVRCKSNLGFYTYLFLIIITISLKYNAIVLLVSIILSYFIFLLLSKKFILRKFMLGSFLITFLVLLIVSVPKKFFYEADYVYDITVPYYETLGIVNEKSHKSKVIFESLKAQGIDLAIGLEKYNSKNCAIPALQSDSFKKDIKGNPDKFRDFYLAEILQKDPYDLLSIKFKHFTYFLENKNGCTFASKLYSDRVDQTIINLYGQPWKPASLSVLSYVNSLVDLLRGSKIVQNFYINLKGSTYLLSMMLIIFMLCPIKCDVKKVLIALSSFSFILILSFFIANLGAFEKYTFPMLLINYCLIYVMFWLLMLSISDTYKNKEFKK